MIVAFNVLNVIILSSIIMKHMLQWQYMEKIFQLNSVQIVSYIVIQITNGFDIMVMKPDNELKIFHFNNEQGTEYFNMIIGQY